MSPLAASRSPFSRASATFEGEKKKGKEGGGASKKERKKERIKERKKNERMKEGRKGGKKYGRLSPLFIPNGW
jgi:hypothetical protein